MTGTGSSRIWTRASGRRGISVPRQEVERNSLHSGANRLKTRLFPAIDRGSTQERMHGRRRTETKPQGAAFSLESNEDPGGPLSPRGPIYLEPTRRGREGTRGFLRFRNLETTLCGRSNYKHRQGEGSQEHH